MCDIISSLIGLVGVGIGAFITLIISKRDRINQLRLAALEKRLETHQEAYTLWANLFQKINDEKSEELNEQIRICDDWWHKKCLYLDPKSREAFKEALSLANYYKFMYQNDSKKKEEIFKKIYIVRELLVKGVGLPSLGEREGTEIKNELKKTK